MTKRPEQKLNGAQRQILTEMATAQRYEQEPVTAMWIAESSDHWFDTPWASSKLPTLIRRGFVEKVDRIHYRITASPIPAGRLSHDPPSP